MYVLSSTSARVLHTLSCDFRGLQDDDDGGGEFLKFNVWFQGHRMMNTTFDFESQQLKIST